MKQYLRKHGQTGQTAILLAIAMIGLLAIVGLAIDGGMLYWNQRRAQNGADAAAIAGVTAMIDEVLADDYSAKCGTASEGPMITLINQYAENNEVPNPDAETGRNIVAYYLIEDANGNRVDLINPLTADSWRVGDTGTIPCKDVVGLRVEASFPQETFLAGVVGLTESNVTVEAAAIYEHREWCTDFAVFGVSTARDKGVVSIIGAGSSITNGGIHSNGGMHLGGGGQDIFLEPGRPVEYDTNGDTNVNTDKIIGGPDPGASDLGIGPVDNYPLPDDFFYRFEDFWPGGFIWNETDPAMRFSSNGDILNGDVTNPDGTLRDGLYVTQKGVKLNGLDNLGEKDPPWRVTFVAKEEVQISGGINQLPLARGIFVYTLSDNTSVGALKVSGSDNKWAGLIAAPNGDVDFSGARNSDLAGMILANKVNFSGSNNSINHRPEFCPPNPPRVLLVH